MGNNWRSREWHVRSDWFRHRFLLDNRLECLRQCANPLWFSRGAGCRPGVRHEVFDGVRRLLDARGLGCGGGQFLGFLLQSGKAAVAGRLRQVIQVAGAHSFREPARSAERVFGGGVQDISREPVHRGVHTRVFVRGQLLLQDLGIAPGLPDTIPNILD